MDFDEDNLGLVVRQLRYCDNRIDRAENYIDEVHAVNRNRGIEGLNAGELMEASPRYRRAQRSRIQNRRLRSELVRLVMRRVPYRHRMQVLRHVRRRRR